jgi:hypothetical protein
LVVPVVTALRERSIAGAKSNIAMVYAATLSIARSRID